MGFKERRGSPGVNLDLRLIRRLGIPPQPEAHKAPEIGEDLSLIPGTMSPISRTSPSRWPAGAWRGQVPKDAAITDTS